MDLQHGSDLVLSSLGQGREAVCVFYDRQPDRIPTMFRDLTPSPTVAFFVSDTTVVRRPDGRAATATRRRSAPAQYAVAPAAQRCGALPASTSEPTAWICLRNFGA